MRRQRLVRVNPLKWVGWLFTPIQKNGAFCVFMFLLGWLCVQMEIMPYYLRNKGAAPYPLALPELFVDVYLVAALLTLLPHWMRKGVRGLVYILMYGVSLIDMYCYVRFESTLTPTMLMLVGETNRQEAQEFLSGYLDWGVLMTDVKWILLLIILHVVWTIIRGVLAMLRQRTILPKVSDAVVMGAKAMAGVIVGGCLYGGISQTWNNKVALCRLFSCDTIGQVEHELTRKEKAELYLPVYRLAFGIYANRLASGQILQIEKASEKVQVDSCSYRVPNIVLVIGESYNRHHSGLYGYDKPTTPRQEAMAAAGELAVFKDVVAPWNLTSFVFKHVFSLHAVGDSGEWCDEPLFPEVFRKAGYHVTFITNQFLPKAREAVYDFSGGFFLNDPALSKRLFDTRNSRLYPLDEGVLKEWKEESGKRKEERGELVILHLMGSHVDYRARYPLKTRSVMRPAMYNRPELSERQKQILAHYDNSLRYNDSIVAAVTQCFRDKDAVVIYMPDHGEEIFDGSPYMYGRMHGAEIDYRLARNEMEIPFWIWGSPLYRERHPYGWQAILGARERPMMTDVLPHLLLYLGGIHTPLYRPELNVISPDYNTARPRLLKGKTDYNLLNEE